MTSNKILNHYPLSSPQQVVWFEQILYPDIPLYTISGYVRIDGPIDPVRFETALNQVIQDNDALRIIIHEGEGLPTQTFAKHIHIPLDFQDFSNHDHAKERAIEWMKGEYAKPFQLYEHLLFQFALCKVSDDCYYWFKKAHHIIVDGWAASLVTKRVAEAYNALSAGQADIQQTRPSYLDYVFNDQAYLDSDKAVQHERYWLDKFRELPEPLLVRKYAAQFQGKIIPSQRSKLVLEQSFYAQLLTFAKEHKASIFHIFLGALYCYFARTGNREDFVVGLPTLNRNNAAFKQTVGMFASTSPAWFQLGTNLSLIELLRAIGTVLQQDYRNQRFPVSEINRQLGLHQVSRQQLFDITLSYAKHSYDTHFNGSLVEAVYFDNGFEQNALTVFIEEFHQHDDVSVYFDYNLGAFDEDEIERFKARFEFLLGEILRKPSVPIREWQIMPYAEYQKILVEFNDTASDYPHDKTIVNLFEEQVDKTPDAIAVVFEDQQLTYQKLNSQANQLAHYLQTLGVKPEILVGICLERSLDMVIGLLGILKAGGAYLPLDPAYPKERLAFVLEDAQVPVLLSQESLMEELPKTQAQVICLDAEAKTLAQKSPENVLSGVGPENLAYVIYTSGSTGNPKGVQIEHVELLNFLTSMQKQPGLASSDVLLAVTTLSFDIAALELYLPLITGAKIVLASRVETKDGVRLLEKLDHDGITVMQATPATWHLLLNSGWQNSPQLKILCGGEALPRELAAQLLEKVQSLWNLYGPTETTIWSTIFQVKEPTDISIGRPIANTQIYILDTHGQPVPIGTAGELYIGGTGVARGYLNRPELTAERFTQNPFSDPKARIYKTGDLVRYRPDGNIEYLNRIDNQVKIRGFRIELGEIEAVLGQHTDVQEVAVIVQENKMGKHLVAYLVSDLIPDRLHYQTNCQVQLENNPLTLSTVDICNGGVCLRGETTPFTVGQELRFNLQLPFDSETRWLTGEVRWKRSSEVGFLFKLTSGEQAILDQSLDELLEKNGILTMLQRTLTNRLRKYLKGKLPDYMIPSAFVLLRSLPLTPNGKIDRRALAQLSSSYKISEEQFVAPRTAEEEILAGLWADVLGIKKVSIHDNFFELGGHSLFATQILSRIRYTFNVEVPLVDLFESPTIAGLNKSIQTARQQVSLPPIIQVDRSQPLQLSFAQQRLWFLDQLEGENATYNMPAALQIEGPLQQHVLKQSLQALVERHESLRTVFPTVNGTPVVQLSEVSYQLAVISLQHLPPSEIEAEVQRLTNEDAQRPFDLENGPLFRTTLLQKGADSYILLVNMHHIISDGWSLSVLIRELSTLYEAFKHNKPSPLPPLPIQYVDFAHWQRQWLSGEELSKQVHYWQQQLTDIPALLELPTDYPRPSIQGFQGSSLTMTISLELTNQLKKLSQQSGTTLFMTLWAAFAILLSRYSSQTDIVVGSPIANRIHRQIEALIGCFVNTLVLRLNLADNPSVDTVLQQARQVALEAYNHQDIPFEQLVETLQPVRSLSHSPLFQIMFVLQNAPPANLELAGLSLTLLEPAYRIAKYDLTLEIVETAAGLSGTLEYNTDLFERATIERLSGHLQTLLTGIVENPKTPIHELPLLTKAERQQLLAWNNTITDCPVDQLFEAQAERTPDAIALVFADQQLTYQALNTKVNQLAHYLQTLGVNPEVLVGICIERSFTMVIGIFAILKLGGAYVPLDPDYPSERLQFMVEDSKIKVLLTQTHLLKRLPVSTAQVVDLDGDWEQIATHSGKNPVRQSRPYYLAYVIYTSGSTGKPKGVMVEHAALSNFNYAAVKTYSIYKEDSVLQFASINFDAAVEEIYPILTQGGRLILRDKGMLDTDQHFLQTCQQKAVTILDLPTAYWQQLIANPDNQKYWPPSVRLVIIGGEAASIQHVNHWQQTLGQNVQLFNTYGPTEATVVASSYPLTESVAHFPIGRPLPNVKIYILDAYHNPNPVGVPGELCIGGYGLARGYLNRIELSQEKFIEVELFGKTERIYKTGDLARYLPDGNIEYLDRIDNQVKIRGFRIELGEIEAILAQYADIQENAVVVSESESGDKRLVAYMTAKQEHLIDNAELRKFLHARLPDYMIPNILVPLETMPLTPNGKIDHRALSQLSVTGQRATTETYLAPRDTLELQLTTIWEEILNVSPIGVRDNFFELGGHSLLAVRLMASVQQQLGKHLPLATLFQSPTVESLAGIFRQQTDAQTWAPLVAIQPNGSKPPLFCVPGAGGNVIYFFELARHLGQDQPFYALQAVGLDGESAPDTRIEDMAARYIREIQTIQPQGPYLLGGHSFGSGVAFEISQQLQQQGQEVALLAIFDTAAPAPVEQILGADWDEADWIVDIAHILEQMLGLKLAVSYEALQPLELHAQFRYLHEKLQESGWLPVGADIKQLRGLVEVFKTSCQIHYVPSPKIYPTPISLFKANEMQTVSEIETQLTSLTQQMRQKVAWGWQKYTKDSVDIHQVPGDHFTMMNQPHVQVLAEKLRACLEKVISLRS
jgi:amino acid adenylation domain-containing protein